MKQTGICKGNIFKIDKLPDNTEVELFDEIFKSKNLQLERIISNGWNKIDDKWYDQEIDEWVFLLKGNASVEFESKGLIELNEGDYIYITAHSKHKVIKTSSEPPCVWLAIHFKEVD